ncbi:MAG: hypothetical protein FWD16_00530 [Clostridia bacterium]|nr:hypothetical protein [Clostridia bacterium]
MKKTLATLLALLLAFALCACGSATNAPVATPGHTQGDQTAQPANTSLTEDDPWLQLEGYIKLEQNILYYEGYTLQSDPGDGLTPQQGAELVLRDLVGAELRSLITPTVCLFIIFEGFEDVNGTECYAYNIAVGTAEDRQLDQCENKLLACVDYQAGTAFLFDDFSHTNPAGDLPSWWGTYVGEGYLIGITNFDGTKFRFIIQMTTTTNQAALLEGLALLEPDDNRQAIHGTGEEFVGLYLNEGDESLDFQASESSEWSFLRGTYYQN